MKKFLVLFCIPAKAIEEWMATTDEAERERQTQSMMEQWQKWMEAHKSVIVDGGLPVGKTKRVTAEGIVDAKNEVNWYLIVQAESHDAAAALFKDHPQLQISSAYIDISDASRQM